MSDSLSPVSVAWDAPALPVDALAERRVEFVLTELATRTDMLAINLWGGSTAPGIPCADRATALRWERRTTTTEDRDPESPSRLAAVRAAVRAHVLGPLADPVWFATRATHRETDEKSMTATKSAGRWRVGLYTPTRDGFTRTIALDCDGSGHAASLADPLGAARVALEKAKSFGLRALLESSKGGSGWHVWILLGDLVPCAKARALGLELAPKDARIVGKHGGLADARANEGIEVFPKSTRGMPVGGQVFAPFFHAAKPGCNRFFVVEGGALVERDPWL